MLVVSSKHELQLLLYLLYHSHCPCSLLCIYYTKRLFSKLFGTMWKKLNQLENSTQRVETCARPGQATVMKLVRSHISCKNYFGTLVFVILPHLVKIAKQAIII